jgi:uncharacterized protein
MSLLTCPVCQGAMREHNRDGILIDSCTQCRGVWLDRGELEKLLAAASQDDGYAHAPQPARHQAPPPPPPPQYQHPQQPYPPHGHHPDPYYGRDDRRYKDDKYYGKRKKSKLEHLFDIFD